MLSVDSAVPHGAKSARATCCSRLDTEKIDRAIADLRAELKLSDVADAAGRGPVAGDGKDRALGPGIQPPPPAWPRRIGSNFSTSTAFRRKGGRLQPQGGQGGLEYEEEELRQLEKMYKADDITEETEQIVLKRARDTVERAKFRVEIRQIIRDQSLKLAIPRADELVKESAAAEIVGLGEEQGRAAVGGPETAAWSWRNSACSGSGPTKD